MYKLMTFKVGDKVRMKSECSGLEQGDECILVKKHVGTLFATIGGKDPDTADGACACQSNWELLGSKSAKYKFKVGDYVKATMSCGEIVVGKIYTVKKGTAHDLIIRENMKSICACEHTWELISKEDTIKVGTKIRFIAPHSGPLGRRHIYIVGCVHTSGIYLKNTGEYTGMKCSKHNTYWELPISAKGVLWKIVGSAARTTAKATTRATEKVAVAPSGYSVKIEL